MAFSLLSALPPAAICPPGFFCWGDVPPGPGTSRETGPGGRGHASQGVGRGLLVAVPVAVPVAVDARLAPAAVRAHRQPALIAGGDGCLVVAVVAPLQGSHDHHVSPPSSTASAARSRSLVPVISSVSHGSGTRPFSSSTDTGSGSGTTRAVRSCRNSADPANGASDGPPARGCAAYSMFLSPP